jgi:hypothetical protein
MLSQVELNESLFNAVWLKYQLRLCFCCQLQEITRETYSCGFLVSIRNGGRAHLANLRPICLYCARSLGDTNLLEFQINSGYNTSEPSRSSSEPLSSSLAERKKVELLYSFQIPKLRQLSGFLQISQPSRLLKRDLVSSLADRFQWRELSELVNRISSQRFFCNYNCFSCHTQFAEFSERLPEKEHGGDCPNCCSSFCQLRSWTKNEFLEGV